MPRPFSPRSALGPSAPLVLLALAAAAAAWAAVRLVPAAAGVAAGLASAAGVAAAAKLVGRRAATSAGDLVRDLRAVRESRDPDAGPAPAPSAPLLGALPAECAELVAALRAARREARKAAHGAAALTEAEKSWLETILQGLSEGVVVCNRSDRITLCNRAAVEMLGAPDRAGLGRGLGELVDLAPLRAALGATEGGAVQAVDLVRSIDGVVLKARIAPLAGPEGDAGGYLVTLEPDADASATDLPARPEFYDFGLMRAHEGDATLTARRLREVDYVVFDCEMTGLHPRRGDEIVQIGAVRVTGGRVLSGETFERIINPLRPIPPASVRYHGLTDADVAEAPPITTVLPEFRTFVGDAVMVAHNAAFDMTFLGLKEAASGVRFDNPVLDTMLVAELLDGEGADHSLDGLCARYGIAVDGRHTALGDTLATAELLLRLIDRLEARGFDSLGKVMHRANVEAELRHRGAAVAHGGEHG